MKKLISFKRFDLTDLVNKPELPPRVQIPDAREVFDHYMTIVLGLLNKKYEWLPEYQAVIDWLSDNDNKGLLLQGKCGVGKSIIARYVIPAIFSDYYSKIITCYNAQELNENIAEVLSKHLICIDDIGTEGESVIYGERRMVFCELIDLAEKKGKLIIGTTNLGGDALTSKYGERAVDRIKAMTKRVLINKQSFRG